MKALLTGLFLFTSTLYLNTAEAYSLDCDQSGSSCKVACDNGQHAGTMYWNGSRWSDGLRSSTDKHELARQIVAAQGTACK
jgi:hypothetical protein